ncbi:lipocalin-like domain-containing protein [Spirosoma jeollabukense]
MSRNNILGTWTLESAILHSKQHKISILGASPHGLLVFTENLYFSVIVSNPEIPAFASGDRLSGSDEENRAVVQNSLALFGTYEVDGEGDFLGQHILSASFPNWTGLDRGRDQLGLRRREDTLLETMPVGDGAIVELVWRRVE